MGPGACFGERSVLRDETVRVSSATVIRGGYLIFIPVAVYKAQQLENTQRALNSKTTALRVPLHIAADMPLELLSKLIQVFVLSRHTFRGSSQIDTSNHTVEACLWKSFLIDTGNCTVETCIWIFFRSRCRYVYFQSLAAWAHRVGFKKQDNSTACTVVHCP